MSQVTHCGLEMHLQKAWSFIWYTESVWIWISQENKEEDSDLFSLSVIFRINAPGGASPRAWSSFKAWRSKIESEECFSKVWSIRSAWPNPPLALVSFLRTWPSRLTSGCFKSFFSHLFPFKDLFGAPLSGLPLGSTVPFTIQPDSLFHRLRNESECPDLMSLPILLDTKWLFNKHSSIQMRRRVWRLHPPSNEKKWLLFLPHTLWRFPLLFSLQKTKSGEQTREPTNQPTNGRALRHPRAKQALKGCQIIKMMVLTRSMMYYTLPKISIDLGQGVCKPKRNERPFLFFFSDPIDKHPMVSHERENNQKMHIFTPTKMRIPRRSKKSQSMLFALWGAFGGTWLHDYLRKSPQRHALLPNKRVSHGMVAVCRFIVYILTCVERHAASSGDF